MEVQILSNDRVCEPSGETRMVDIIAIHGLHEGQLETWIEPHHKVLWLRDLLPHDELKVRVLAYGYAAESLLRPGGTADGILPFATTMIAELCAFRELSNTSERPIIFVCHGFGGILLERALVYSKTSRGDQVRHRKSIYTSTYAILFMGTPHKGLSRDVIHAMSKHRILGPNQFLLSLLKNSEVLENISSLFSPLEDQLKISYFWEQLDSKVRGFKGRLVGEESAAPAWQDTDRCGIMANHSDMVKFKSQQDQGFVVVFAALRRYLSTAVGAVGHRWEQERRDSQKIALTNSSADTAQPYKPFQRVLSVTKNGHDINQIYAVNRSSTNYFTGRQLYAKDMKEAFWESRNGTSNARSKIFVIYGLGGSGKTQFCLKYIEDNRSRYWGIFWIDASSEENAESSFASIALQAGKGTGFVAGIHWLSSQSKPWMLVIDNADDPDMDLTKYFPRNNHGHILVTTRHPGFTSMSTIGSFRFHGMDPEEATVLLLRSAHLQTPGPSDKQTRKLAQMIASELGYLALALNHAGVTIRRNIYTIDKYLHYYLGYRKEMISHTTIKSIDDANIITTWEIPYRKFEARVSLEYRDAVDVLRVFAFLHFESISEDVFTNFWSASNGHYPRVADFPDILQNKRMLSEESLARLRRAFGVLCDYSIIDYDHSNRSCSLHPVIHAWARSRLTASDYSRFLHVTTTMVSDCISPTLEVSGRSFRRQLLPHIDAVLRTLQKTSVSYPNSVLDAAMLERFTAVYSENGLWRVARDWQRKVVQIRSNRQWRFQEGPLHSQKALADINWNLFDVKACVGVQWEIAKVRWVARPMLRDWLTWPPWKPLHTTYCNALTDLTQSLWLAGEFALSKRAGEQALSGLLVHLGLDDPLTLNAMFNLGRTYHHLMDFEKSHKLLLFVVNRRKHFFGNDHPETLMARSELGINHRALGHLAVAEKIIENVLTTRKRILGEEHAYTLWSVNEYSKILCDRDRPGLAVKVLEDILPVVTRTLGDDHAGMVMTRANLARAYAICKCWEKAASILQDLSANIAGHPDWVIIMCGYIHVRVRMGRILETQDDCEGVLLAIVNKRIVALNSLYTYGLAETLVKIYDLIGSLDRVSALYQEIPGLKEVLEQQKSRDNSIFSELYASRSELNRSRDRLSVLTQTIVR